MSKELFLKVRDLSQKKRKNEEAVPMEVLTTKYKVPYENLCSELKESQQQLRMDYMESIRVLTDLAATSVYLDLSNDEEWSVLLLKCNELRRSPNLLTRELIKAFVIAINSYARGDKNEQC